MSPGWFFLLTKNGSHQRLLHASRNIKQRQALLDDRSRWWGWGGGHTLDQQEGKGGFCGGGRGARACFTAGPSCPCPVWSPFKTTRQPAVTCRHSTKGVVLGAPGPIFPHSLDRDEPREQRPCQQQRPPAPNRGGARTPVPMPRPEPTGRTGGPLSPRARWGRHY